MRLFDIRYYKVNLIVWNKKIRDFLRSERCKESLIFLFFLVISYAFWTIVSLNEISEMNFKVPLRYTNIPDKAFVTSELPHVVNVRLRDRGTVLLNYTLNRFSPIEINFENYSNNKDEIFIPSAQLISEMKKRLVNSTALVSFSPDTVAIYYTMAEGKKVPVRLVSHFSTKPQCVISENIQLKPDSVMIYAPRKLLATINEVYTDSVYAENLTDTLRTVVPLSLIEGSKAIPGETTVTVPVEEVILKTLEIPLTVASLPASLKLLTFPAKVKAECMVPMSLFSSLSNKDINLEVDYKKVRRKNVRKLPVEIISYPDFVLNIQVKPDSVEYILEENQFD